jgi:predicted phage terminase large subunit-like protein
MSSTKTKAKPKTDLPLQKRIKLHPTQQAFYENSSLFRSFVGGIGSGKSWCGSFDMICKAKAGRLYLVAAPTFGMLADSTFRSFLAVGQELGVIDHDKVNRSAPPSVRLRTGAEVLFRSADDPDRLRGPNLSGVWLDEASLMEQAAFDVAIGRLREGGEQGWLTATFTPKGRKHWTHEVFNTSRPDTAIFHSKTSDNPFLPEGFDATVRGQYTSALADQELGGLFTDIGGTMFKRDWFSIVEPAQVPTLTEQVRCWDLASTPKDERKSHDPDYTAGVKMGRAENGDFYLTDVKRLRASPRHVEQVVEYTARVEDGHGVSVWMEREPGSSGVAVIDHYRRLLADFDFEGERSTGSKVDRALPLAAQAEHGAVKLLRAPWNRDFLDEAESFPFGSHDDQVDAASMALVKLAQPRKKLWIARFVGDHKNITDLAG